MTVERERSNPFSHVTDGVPFLLGSFREKRFALVMWTALSLSEQRMCAHGLHPSLAPALPGSVFDTGVSMSRPRGK